MDSQHNLFIIAFLFVSFMIWQVWEKDKNPHPQQHRTNTAVIAADNTANQDIYADKQGRRVIAKTDVLELTINTYGGDIEQALLLTYLKDLKSNEPFQLLQTKQGFIYQAQSGLMNCNYLEYPEHHKPPLYKIETDNFMLTDDKDEIIISMSYLDAEGNTFKKIFTLKRGEYAVNMTLTVQNAGIKPLKILNFGQLRQSIDPSPYDDIGSNSFSLQAFRGAAYSTSHSKYEKYKFNAIANDKNLNIHSKGGWIAMLQQYFASAWIPDADSTNNFYTVNLGNGIVAIGYKSQPVLVQPGQTSTFNSTLWVGPEIQDKMAAIAPHLDLTVDYGWLWFLSQPMFKLLKFIHNFLNNWGFSIIAITFIVRGVMYPFTRAQYTSMAKMLIIQPKIQRIRERFNDDKQRQSQELMALYKEEKINPLGGCFPLFIQMPIFLALYYMLMGSVELRHAPFALWLRDLSTHDPYYILPILMGITMYFIQKISPSTITDPMQQKIMRFMPIIFTIFFLWFPSGLVLYYIVSNLVTIIQQHLIYRELEKRGLHHRKKKKIK